MWNQIFANTSTEICISTLHHTPILKRPCTVRSFNCTLMAHINNHAILLMFLNWLNKLMDVFILRWLFTVGVHIANYMLVINASSFITLFLSSSELGCWMYRRGNQWYFRVCIAMETIAVLIKLMFIFHNGILNSIHS